MTRGSPRTRRNLPFILICHGGATKKGAKGGGEEVGALRVIKYPLT